MKDRLIKLLCVFLILISLTGCVRYESRMNITAKKSMTYSFTYAVDKKLAPKPVVANDILERYMNAGFDVKDFDDGNYIGHTFTAHIGNIDTISSIAGAEYNLLYLDPDSPESFSNSSQNKPILFKKKDDIQQTIYTAGFVFDLNKTSFGSIKDLIEQAKAKNITNDFENNGVSPFVFTLMVTVPYNIVGSNNATSITGKTLRWDLSDFINKPDDKTDKRNSYWQYQKMGDAASVFEVETTTTAPKLEDSIVGAVYAKSTTTKSTTTTTTTEAVTTTTTKEVEIGTADNPFTTEKEGNDEDSSYRRNIYFSFDIPNKTFYYLSIGIASSFILLVFWGIFVTIRRNKRKTAIDTGRTSVTVVKKGKNNKILKGKLVIPPEGSVPVETPPVVPDTSGGEQVTSVQPVTAVPETVVQPQTSENNELTSDIQMQAFGGGPIMNNQVETPITPVAPAQPVAPVEMTGVPVQQPVVQQPVVAPVPTPEVVAQPVMAAPVEQPIVETPLAPVPETPVQQAVPMAPVAEVVETPIVEAPMAPVETPVVAVPTAEATPVVEAPVVAAPVVPEAPVAAPVVETPIVEAPITETPMVAEPVAAQSAETPVVNEPEVAPVVVAPAIETPVVAEPVDAPVFEEPKQVEHGELTEQALETDTEAPENKELEAETIVDVTPVTLDDLDNLVAQANEVIASPIAQVDLPVVPQAVSVDDTPDEPVSEPLPEEPITARPAETVVETPLSEPSISEAPGAPEPVIPETPVQEAVAMQMGNPLPAAVETPVAEVVETPIAETPVIETPVVPEPAPVVDAPVVETPVVPMPEVPVQPVVAQPVVQEQPVQQVQTVQTVPVQPHVVKTVQVVRTVPVGNPNNPNNNI